MKKQKLNLSLFFCLLVSPLMGYMQNVCIGCTNPEEKLTVAGNIKVRDTTFLSGAIYIDTTKVPTFPQSSVDYMFGVKNNEVVLVKQTSTVPASNPNPTTEDSVVVQIGVDLPIGWEGGLACNSGGGGAFGCVSPKTYTNTATFNLIKLGNGKKKRNFMLFEAKGNFLKAVNCYTKYSRTDSQKLKIKIWNVTLGNNPDTTGLPLKTDSILCKTYGGGIYENIFITDLYVTTNGVYALEFVLDDSLANGIELVVSNTNVFGGNGASSQKNRYVYSVGGITPILIDPNQDVYITTWFSTNAGVYYPSGGGATAGTKITFAAITTPNCMVPGIYYPYTSINEEVPILTYASKNGCAALTEITCGFKKNQRATSYSLNSIFTDPNWSFIENFYTANHGEFMTLPLGQKEGVIIRGKTTQGVPRFFRIYY